MYINAIYLHDFSEVYYHQDSIIIIISYITHCPGFLKSYMKKSMRPFFLVYLLFLHFRLNKMLVNYK